MKYNFTLFIIIIGLGLLSCETEVEGPKIEIEEKVAIFGFISPEVDTIRISINRVKSIFDITIDLDDQEGSLEEFLITDAQVTLSNAVGASLPLEYLAEEEVYIATQENFPILPGQEYFLEVLADGEVFTSSCVIPANQVAAIEGEIENQSDDFGNNFGVYQFQFEDILGEDNFYVLGLQIVFENEEGRTVIYDSLLNEDSFQTDNIGDGSVLGASGDFYVGSFINPQTGELEGNPRLTFQVMHADENLYNLLRVRFEDGYYGTGFFTEVQIPPNNIKGAPAVGLFAGYRYLERTLAIE